jgi:hypothetical protein
MDEKLTELEEDPLDDGEDAIKLLEGEETVVVHCGELRVKCSWNVLRRRSEFFDSLYRVHDEETDASFLPEEYPDKAAWVLKELHRVTPVGKWDWDFEKAGLCAKWLIPDFIAKYKQLMVNSLGPRVYDGAGYHMDNVNVSAVRGCSVVNFMPIDTPVSGTGFLKTLYKGERGVVEWVGGDPLRLTIKFSSKVATARGINVPSDSVSVAKSNLGWDCTFFPLSMMLSGSVLSDTFWEMMDLAYNNAAYQIQGFISREDLVRYLKKNRHLCVREGMVRVFTADEAKLLIEAMGPVA